MIDKRDHLIQTALTLFASEGITVPTAKIAKEAGVANGTLFNYFPSKQDLMDGIYLDIKKELLPLFLDVKEAKNLQETIFMQWQRYIHWAIENPLKHQVMALLKSSHCLSQEAMEKTQDSYRPLQLIFQNGVKKSEIVDIGFEYFCQILASQIDAAINFAAEKKLKGKALEKHLQTGFAILWKGVTP
jgi:AcrR family transcriptional regulator